MSFGYGGELGMGKIPTQECRPDPEMLLQRSRARKENCEKALDLLRQLAEIPMSLSLPKDDFYESVCQYIGVLNTRIWDEEREISRLLEEINKG